MKPDVVESGRVYFLGDEYVDRVVRDGEVVYNRNYWTGSSSKWEEDSWTIWHINFVQKTVEELNVNSGDHLALSAEMDNTIDENLQGKENTQIRMGVYVYKKDGSKLEEEWSTVVEAGKIGNVFLDYEIKEGTSYIYFYKFRKNNKSYRQTAATRKNKLELGTTATPYTVAPEDLFPSTQTFPSFPEWPDEGGY